MFTEDENLWDFHRGRQLEEELRPKASEIAVLDKLAKMLRESKWRASSRSLYNTWFRTWMQFCKTNKQNPMKARPKWVCRYLTYLTVYKPNPGARLRNAHKRALARLVVWVVAEFEA